jgi:hypothetical protein
LITQNAINRSPKLDTLLLVEVQCGNENPLAKMIEIDPLVVYMSPALKTLFGETVV